MDYRQKCFSLGVTIGGTIAILTSGCSDAPTTIPSVDVNAPAVVAPAPPSTATVAVTRVVDGDTFDVPEGRVRVLVMDSCEKGTPGGTRATAQAHQLLDGQQVTLAAEPGHDKDRYGRLLRYVSLPGGGDYATVMLRESHTGVYSGRSDASSARTEQGRAADADGRDCGGVSGTTAPATAARTTTPKPAATTSKPVHEVGSGYDPSDPSYQGADDPGTVAGRGKTSGETQRDWLCESGTVSEGC